MPPPFNLKIIIMQIKVIKTTTASQYPCGTKLFVYEAGNTYDIYEDLAKVFLKEGWGKKEEQKQKKEEEKEKQQKEAEEAKLKAKQEAEEQKAKQEAEAKKQQDLADDNKVETQDLPQEIETQELKIEQKPKKNANK